MTQHAPTQPHATSQPALEVFICPVVPSVVGDEYTVVHPCPLQDMDDLSFVNKEAIRTACCLSSTLVATFRRIAKDCNAPVLGGYSFWVRHARTSLVGLYGMAVSRSTVCVDALYASVSHEDWLTFLNSDNTRRCGIDGGPSPQSIRDLLAPTASCRYTWMGNAFAPPILDQLYCFTASPASFVSCWTPCPADASCLDKLAVLKRVTQLLTRGDLDSPAHALAEVLHGESSERLAPPRNTEDRKHLQSTQSAQPTHLTDKAPSTTERTARETNNTN